MNERIRELAEQAGFIVDQSGSIMVCFTSNGDSEVKKFAELVVRECANTIQDFVDHRFPASEYPDRLRRYFGVEE